jgi:putative selenate reductase
MSDLMRPLPYVQLVLRALAEYRKKGSILDIPAGTFWKQDARAAGPIFSLAAAGPVGPAAGPHTQLAQNILASWLAGARYIELKTVQKLDSLKIDKPCIDAADEGYNVEWSTELSLEQAADEYIKAWFLLHVFQELLFPAGAAGTPGFLFNMSVGYDLEGIRTPRMNAFIDRLVDASADPLFSRCAGETAELARLPGLLAGTPWEGREAALEGLAARVRPGICASVTLSTMHGCPPGEIEAICGHMLGPKKLDTLVKLNPTLLGHDAVRSILDSLGFTSPRLNPAGFAKDLQWDDAVPMLTRLRALAGKQGRFFGTKLSNTLAVANDAAVLPGAEKYMSGRALYPLTVSLAARLAEAFAGELPMSFSGGISAWNIEEILACGIRPVTVATDLLKPGGYARLKQLAELSANVPPAGAGGRVKPEGTRAAAARALSAPFYRKDFRGSEKVAVAGPLPLLDCFVAPCIEACPIGQDIPEYVHLLGEGKFEQAFDVIYSRNPLPFMTGYLCDHQCTASCTRLDWEGAVRIREAKRIAAEKGYGRFVVSGVLAGRKAGPRRVKAAILGAGPAGLAAAAFLGREGFEVHLFESETEAGGVVRYLLPAFRIPADAAAKDVALLRDLGVRFHFAEKTPRTLDSLSRDGFGYVLVAIGAQADKDTGIEGARPVLAFLREFRANPGAPALGRSVVVVGAGDTAMDAARAAKRCRGVEEVRIVYRRSEKEMPCSAEEFESARAEGIGFSFLRAPVSWADGQLTCSVMTLAEPDASGRARPVAGGTTEDFPADSVISAIGAEVDTVGLSDMGFPGTELTFDPATQETSIPGVFLLGDAASGASTIVKAIASARRAADAICAREGGSHYRNRVLPREDTARLRLSRDSLVAASVPDADDETVARTEARRCLGCRALCMKCVEVCPNRANTIVAVAGLRDEGQIVHLDAFCNECGNCATFCPWEGRPYKDKLTVFSLEKDFHESGNPGFYLSDGKGLLRLDGTTAELVLDGSGKVPEEAAPAPVRAVIEAVACSHAWLLGPVEGE